MARERLHNFLKRLEEFAKSPLVELVVGLILVGTGLVEAGESLFEDLSAGNVGVHHGIIVLGVVHAIKALPGTIAGMGLLLDAEQRQKP